ncbi:IclR family transcriptional regulator [Yoonia sediminilitoris]|uniref:IclR family transcriptional regulator n=1 Tax=Yoonia sediminilitoris TaxID=1286148 RepID=A0A2T6KC20_9RHOB|nr:IclR family transcriptional regulator [Yoonia sediminilitoris]PUB12396.1 IclR family transcriptional regulator [Yoonia sediminilitoris]RCW93090.1 IclR family transcriptional regulator [Yoonia sediminilitoris]
MGTTAKALALLELFSVDRPEIGLSDFYRLAGRDKATVHRYLTELEQTGFVEQDMQSRLYRLGPAVLRLAAIRETCFPLHSAVEPLVRAAALSLGELVHFSLLQGRSLATIAHHDPHRHGTAVVFDHGAILPLHGTASGISLLAFGPAALWKGIGATPLPSFTGRTPRDEKALHRLSEDARQLGFAVADRTFDPDVVSVAMPVFGSNGTASGAVAVAAPAGRMDDALRARAIATLHDLAPILSQSLGGRMAENMGVACA